MSVKFEKDTLRQTAQNAMGNIAPNGQIPGTSGKHPLAEKVGTALTGGVQNAGTKGYLAVSLNPISMSPRVQNCVWANVDFLFAGNVGLYQAARIESSPNQDAHGWLAGWRSGVHRLVAR